MSFYCHFIPHITIKIRNKKTYPSPISTNMKEFIRIVYRSFSLLFCLSFFTFNQLQAQDGKALFTQKCAACHAIDKDLTGPALKGIEERVSDQKLLYAWIRNNQKVLASGDKYFTELYAKWNKTQMNLFTELTDQEIAAILTYVKDWKPAVKPTPNAATDNSKNSDGDAYFWLSIALIVLLIVVLILTNLLRALRRISEEKQGIDPGPIVPFYKKKLNIALVCLILIAAFACWLTEATIGLGRHQNYQPEQPIFYSHKVHAGTNQINCLYCHTSAQQGKVAGVPSVNVCMNCHAAINEYKGEQLVNAEGKKIDGTAEIQKLYDYAGWDPQTKRYAKQGKPIEWVRIHNLPDHVLFNHSHHLVNAKQNCQTCHGEIQTMHEVKQFADLSMGWCVNCHRNTKVQFKENGFYSIYQKYHHDLKEGKIDSVTAEMIGANECQKCHY